MNTIRIAVLMVLLSVPTCAREIRTPLIVQRGPINELFLELKRDWSANFWVGEYFRHTKKAYDNCGDKTNYSYLYFGKGCFNAQDAFANSTASSATNPLLATSILGPRVKYREQATMIGLNLQGWLTDTWRIGFRANVPFRKIRVKRLQSKGNGTSSLGGQTIADVTQEKVETINGARIQSFAYRLDFLSRLPYTCSCLGLNYPIVNYRDTDFPFDLPVTISNQDITNENGTPVSVIKSTTGTLPRGPFAIEQSVAQQLPIVSAEGGGIDAGGRGRFAANIDYTPLSTNSTAQSKLFIVPSVTGTHVVAPARIIEEHVDELLDCISPTAESVFTSCQISFASQCTKGPGDFDTELFAGHCFNDCFYGELFVGIRWPTAKRLKNSLAVFKQPLGNNGHFESKVGLQALWEPACWVAFKGDLAASLVHKDTERVAAAFRGATIKNIGPCVPATVGWNYFTLHADLIFTIPSKSAGLDIGYELYHKSYDRIMFQKGATYDCLNVYNPLNAQSLVNGTQVTSHKIRSELFWDFCFFKYEADFFLGASHIIGGRNTPIETDVEFGFTFFF